MPPIASPIEPKPGLGRARAGLAEPRDVHEDDAGVVGRERRRSRGPSRASVPGLKFSSTTSQRARDATRDVTAARVAQVDRDRTLVAGDRRPPEAPAVDADAVAAHDVAGAGRLDLDDVGAEIAEQLARERPRDERAELEHAQAGQRGVRHGPKSRVSHASRGGRNGVRTERPHRRAEGQARRVRQRGRPARRADLPRPARRVGRPALPAAGHGGAEGRGPQARPLEPVPARGRPRPRAHRTSSTRRCAR